MERSLNLVLPVKHAQIGSAGAGGAETIALQPPVGELWIVDFANLVHDDNVASRACSWSWYDGVTSVVLYTTPAAIALNTYLGLYFNAPTGGYPFVCSNAAYLTATAVGLTAGKKIYIDYVVRRLCGVEPWTNV